MSKQTDSANIAYYEEHADVFASETLETDLSELIDQFLGYLPEPDECGTILELGCGAGRDAKVMLSRGYDVDLTDGSPELCRIASAYTGHLARVMLFSELDEVERYQGIWACGSLLHVPKDELPDIMGRCYRALKEQGVFYASFKFGDHDGFRNGRYYSDMGVEELQDLVDGMGDMEILDLDVTKDTLPNRPDLRWVNVFARKISSC